MSSTADNNLIQPGALENLDELTTSTQDALGLPYGTKKAQEMPFSQSAVDLTQPVSGTAIGDFETQTNLVVEAWQQDEFALPLLNSRGEQIDSLLGLPNSETDLGYGLSGFSAAADTLTTSVTASAPKQIVFVDGSVSDSDQLISDLAFQADVIYIDSTRDGVTQISEALSGREDVAAVHILTHGAAGSLQLGATTLDSATLASYQTQLQSWAGSLTENADILIYGCDVASTIGGQAFVDRIGQWTGADVAASDDLTGNVALGGDWALEYQRGVIDARSLSSSTYQETLASVALSDAGKLSVQSSTGAENNLYFSIVDENIIIQKVVSFYGFGIETLNAGSGITQIDDYQVSVALSDVDSLKIDTGSGQDTITFSSGWDSVTSSLDVEIDTGDDIDVVIFGTDLNTKGGALSISTGAGEDKIQVSGNLYTQGGEIDFAADKIEIDAGQTLSTRNTAANGLLVSVGNSGRIQLTGEQITIGDSVDGVAQLLAHVDNASTYSAGDIDITVSETEEAASIFDGLEQSKAELTISNATL